MEALIKPLIEELASWVIGVGAASMLLPFAMNAIRAGWASVGRGGSGGGGVRSEAISGALWIAAMIGVLLLSKLLVAAAISSLAP